jgi:hypothetical protein
MKSSSLVMLAAAALSFAAVPAFATEVTGLKSTLTVTPEHYVGRCPGVITFHGVLHVRESNAGRVGPGAEIGYQFSRSDGATGQNKFVETHGPGDYPITETWTLGGSQVPNFDGWEKFKAWPTDSAQNKTGTVWSNEAHFTLRCR